MIGGRELITKAVQTLRSGGLVAFPTETVYGLGADATSAEAVEKIFRAKGRPSTNPLIVHCSDAGVARRYAKRWSAEAEKLATAFWPGPLTLVVMKQETIVSAVTAGKPTVGLRVPSHALALEMLRQFDGPVAAPSANRSNRVSPTTAEHVNAEIGAAVDIILDGGACDVGIESTVLDLTGVRPAVLRPGMVTVEQIQAVLGDEVKMDAATVKEGEAAKSPGQQAVHYAPSATTFRYEKKDVGKVIAWCRSHGGTSWAILTIGSPGGELSVLKDELTRAGVTESGRKVVSMPDTPEEYARKLYATLRELDRMGVATMWLELPPTRGAWGALRDRLTRASKVSS